MKYLKLTAALLVAPLLAGCVTSEFDLTLPDGKTEKVAFYASGNTLDDLLIVKGVNHFGEVSITQMEDPVGFTMALKSGEEFSGSCSRKVKKDDEEEQCVEFRIVKSTFAAIPEGTVAAMVLPPEEAE